MSAGGRGGTGWVGWWLVLAAGLALAGCASRGKAAGGSPDDPVLLPDPAVVGRVVSVNPALRFVVMDFGLRRLPAVEQRLNVYREGRKIGEVKVTGPVVETAIAGDITAGTVELGDEVRED
jgi:hypothetical protein